MKMKISLQIPLKNWDDFVLEEDFEFTLTDFILEDLDYRDRYVAMRKQFKYRECWLDNSFNEEGFKHGISAEIEKLLQAATLLEPTHIVCMESIDPAKNLQLIEESVEVYRKHFGRDVSIVGVWRGTKMDYLRIKEMTDLVALPYDEPREILYKVITGAEHFLGFRGTWETESVPMRGIDTDAPILAAVNGIDFRNFKGRPLGMKKYDPSISLTKAEVTLAISNINEMRRTKWETKECGKKEYHLTPEVSKNPW
jgi:hypothetical protein